MPPSTARGTESRGKFQTAATSQSLADLLSAAVPCAFAFHHRCGTASATSVRHPYAGTGADVLHPRPAGGNHECACHTFTVSRPDLRAWSSCCQHSFSAGSSVDGSARWARCSTLLEVCKSEAKCGKQRIESNRYKRWQTIKYVVLLAGLIAAFFGSMVIGTLDPVQLVGSIHRTSSSPCLQFRDALPASSTRAQPRRTRFKTSGKSTHTVLQATVLDFRQAHFAQASSRHPLPYHSLGEHAHHPILVPVDLPTGSAARLSFTLVDIWPAQGCFKLRQVQSVPAQLPGRR